MAVEAQEQAAMPAAVRALAEELLTSMPALAKAMADHLHATMPELAGSDDEELQAETRDSCAANIDQLLRLMRLGASPDAFVVPVDAAEYVRSFARRGFGVPGLLRSYRLGHAWLWDRWSHELQARIADHDELAAAQDSSAAFMFAYVDGISDVLVEEYGTERERMMRGVAQLRAETVRAILAGEAIDEEVAAGRLGYELRRHHVALRVWSATSEVRGLERAAGEAAAALGAGEPLVLPSGVARLDVWCGSFEPAATEPLEAYEPPPGIRVAFGAPGHRVAGFRRSHGEAVQAARISALGGDAAPAVTGYRHVELVSLLASDLPRARVFVATQLGPLAVPTEPAERLRETVRAYLAAGCSSTRVAKELFVHQNTVANRVKRAEELLGRRVTDSSIELTCALSLVSALGPSLLSEEAGRADNAG
jgi:hypothetical protein